MLASVVRRFNFTTGCLMLLYMVISPFVDSKVLGFLYYVALSVNIIISISGGPRNQSGGGGRMLRGDPYPFFFGAGLRPAPMKCLCPPLVLLKCPIFALRAGLNSEFCVVKP